MDWTRSSQVYFGALYHSLQKVLVLLEILDDVAENNTSFKEAFKNRINESGPNFKRKAVEKLDRIIEGSGYKSLPRKTLRQSRSVRGLRRISSKRRKKRSKTIKRKRVEKRKTKRKTKKRPNKKLKRVRVKSKKKIKKTLIFSVNI